MSRTYLCTFSSEDDEFVATCSDFPSLSYLHKDAFLAVEGLKEIIETYENEKSQTKEINK